MAWIGIDLGGTKVFGVLYQGEKVKKDAKRKTPRAGGREAVVDTIVAVVDDLGGAAAVLGVWVGTGVGGGLILDGTLRRGDSGYAGEIGHTIVHPGGRVCGCGGRGHLEAYAGRAALEREARERHAAGTPTALVELAGDARMTSRVWASALDASDVVAIELLDEAV